MKLKLFLLLLPDVQSKPTELTDFFLQLNGSKLKKVSLTKIMIEMYSVLPMSKLDLPLLQTLSQTLLWI